MAISTLGSDSATAGPTCGRAVTVLHRVKKAGRLTVTGPGEEWGWLRKVQFDSEWLPELRPGNLKGSSTVVALSPESPANE